MEGEGLPLQVLKEVALEGEEDPLPHSNTQISALNSQPADDQPQAEAHGHRHNQQVRLVQADPHGKQSINRPGQGMIA